MYLPEISRNKEYNIGMCISVYINKYIGVYIYIIYHSFIIYNKCAIKKIDRQIDRSLYLLDICPMCL